MKKSIFTLLLICTMWSLFGCNTKDYSFKGMPIVSEATTEAGTQIPSKPNFTDILQDNDVISDLQLYIESCNSTHINVNDIKLIRSQYLEANKRIGYTK